MRHVIGFLPAVVVDNVDPEKCGRIKVTVPWADPPGGPNLETWARFATLMAGDNRGSFFIPDVGDEVLVAFDGPLS